MTRSTLDFFAAKASARRRTAVLVALFALAWASTIAVVYAIVVWVASAQPRLLGPGPLRTRDLLGVAGIVTLVTAGGALVHAVRLASGGGRAVAELLGGFPVDPDTQDAAERRLVNVVEEMAIAAGVPVPALYVLPFERNLNAFAAGFSPDHAVVAVTRGALEGLTRDELQGVVAHELSHVVNADTRLNLQLIALVGGLTSLALVGRALVRAGAGGEGRRGRGRGGAAGLALFGALVWLAGSIGAFFGSLIRAAVSRTREFLADADAVRLTRNPEGLAGALARIAREGSRLWSPAAPEAAHLFIADGLAVRLFATHPPIEERIRRIAPLVAERLLAEEAAPERPPEAASAAPAVPGHGLATAALAAEPGSTPGAAGSDVARAQALLAALP
ncbi:M48 family metallopeptidase, partial [Anaeromyxobacter sp. SG17]|uniref:M48 family metallopeptidase n=1 Tax=Anaeromyxobacter sp. SG17 TaxID=2925405 RepID=UPI001F5960E9